MNTQTIREFKTNFFAWFAIGKKVYRLPILLLPAFLVLFTNDQILEATISSLSDAYVQVSVFVAITLLIYYFIEYFFKLDIRTLLQNNRSLQIPIAAVMGALPGCGGAIIIITQYMDRRLGFGSMVAVLCSTMGDAAFLLIASEPKTALFVTTVSIIAGTMFGYLVEWLHGYDYLRLDNKPNVHTLKDKVYQFNKLRLPWMLLLIPGTAVGLMVAFQIEADVIFNTPGLENLVGVTGAVVCLIYWFINPFTGTSAVHRVDKGTEGQIFDKTIMDTSFVTVWVILAYLVFEVGMVIFNFDLKTLFSNHYLLVPLIAILIGFIPGCGPQVLVTTTYLAGFIPLSAQLGNSISNDGDALFPALAISTKISLVATIYTAIPALIVSYGFLYLFEY